MNEKDFMNDLWDVLRGNTDNMTVEQFRSKYDSLFTEVDSNENAIRMADGHNEWRLMLQKTWCDATQC